MRRSPNGRCSPVRTLSLCAAAAALAATLGCGTEKTVPTGPDQVPDPTATFTRVQKEIFTPSCAINGPGGCHAGPSPQLGMSLEAGRAYANTVGVPSAESTLLRVAPGSPNDSYLVVKVRADAAIIGSRMPLGGPDLPADKVKLLTDWIRRGAPND